MTERKLSTLGYLMDRLGLSTAALARRLHVDASLVSKWRSGSRRLSAKSVYFDEVCRMLLEQNPMALTDASAPWFLWRNQRGKKERAERGGTAACQRRRKYRGQRAYLADRREQKRCFTAC